MAFSVYDTVALLIVFFTTLFLLVFCYAVWTLKYFDRKLVKVFVKPKLFFGHMYDIFMEREHFAEMLTRLYKACEGHRYTGFFSFFTPTLFVRDLDIIKRMCTESFNHFTDHKMFMDEDGEPLLARNLFFLQGHKWKEMRASLSPAFTSAKMKSMFPLVMECSEAFRDYLLKLVPGNDTIELEMKENVTKYTNDVIASTAFGFKINTFEDEKNEFYEMGKKATNFSGLQFIKFQLYALIPSIMRKLKVALFSKDVSSYYRNLVHREINKRDETGFVRHDMIHLLMLAKKGSLVHELDLTQQDDERFKNIQGNDNQKQTVTKREWSNDDLTAQAVAFIIAGFGTPSSMLAFLLYELAKNPDVQEKLIMEIDEANSKTTGDLSYNELLGLKYLDNVISETLRLWPPDAFIERVCVKSFDLPPQNENSDLKYHVKKNDEFIIPIYSIHHDPEYFPDPEKFIPERFSNENKHNIKPYSYIPFGAGPRLCIGAKFALMEAKTLLYHTLTHFEVTVTKKTDIPFRLANDTFNMHPKNGLWLGFKRRIEKN